MIGSDIEVDTAAFDGRRAVVCIIIRIRITIEAGVADNGRGTRHIRCLACAPLPAPAPAAAAAVRATGDAEVAAAVDVRGGSGCGTRSRLQSGAVAPAVLVMSRQGRGREDIRFHIAKLLFEPKDARRQRLLPWSLSRSLTSGDVGVLVV